VQASFLFHDYETFGTNPALDRACQFAAVRTDADFKPSGDPLVVYCQPGEERLPHPQACLITGITPQLAQREGLCEADFTAAIEAAVSVPLTCTLGYNNFRFDDEFTRNLLYRNLYDPYTHEWKNGNSRFDLIDLTRMFSALRPDGINWPQHEDGTPSYRLEDLAAANALEHGQAHDALADVRATIGLARLLAQANPKLWQWGLSLRDKHKVEQLLATHELLLHSSSRYPAKQHCTALITPLARHPDIASQMIVYDLSVDPRQFAGLDSDQLEDLLFTSSADLPEDYQRLPVKTIKLNRAPMLAPINTLPDVSGKTPGTDIEAARRHREHLQADAALSRRIVGLFAQRQFHAVTDPDRMIYQGFFSSADRALLQRLRQTNCRDWPHPLPAHDDERIPEMLFRYRARNHPDSLTPAEQQHWHEHCRRTLSDCDHLPLQDYLQLLQQLRLDASTTASHGDAALSVLDQLQAWALQLARTHAIDLNPDYS